MTRFLFPSATSLSIFPAGSCRSSVGFPCRQCVSSRQLATTIAPSDDYDEELAYKRHDVNVAAVRKMLRRDRSNRLEAMVTADRLGRLCIDHHFSEEICGLVRSVHDAHEAYLREDRDLLDVTLSFKLLRERGYFVSSDMLRRFTNQSGEFDPSLSRDIRGLLSLHDASYLNTGEDILYKAKEFSRTQLKACANYLRPDLAKFVRHSLEHPYHLSLQQYKARHHLAHLRSCRRRIYAIEELAAAEFRRSKLLHQGELQKVIRWWRDLGLAPKLPLARDQMQKWYMWPMTMLEGPALSKHRLELTKVISFIYIMDDIFDLMGSTQDLSLLTEAVKRRLDVLIGCSGRWDTTAPNALPSYMRAAYMALYNVTNEMAEMAQREHGYNPMQYFSKAWAMLFEAFLIEARWFASQYVPTADEYLRNGVVSTGMPVLLVHLFFLLGQGVTQEAMELIACNPPLISSTAKILRLWDDLGTAKDEGQEGFDGSYMDCYMKEHPWCSSHNAQEHIASLISDEWEQLNIECFARRSFSPQFIKASLNGARMVRVMYAYDEEQKLPALHEYANMLLL